MLPKNYIKPTEYAAGGATKKKTKSGSPKPTNPSLWSRAKALAKQKFDVYPSAYANGWAAKWYKENGGGWSGGSNKKADGGPVNKVNALLNSLSEYDTKMSDSERRFMYQQQLDKRRQALFNENSRVERVRKNVLPAAKELAEVSKKILDQQGPEAIEAFDYFQEMLNPEGETDAERKTFLRQKINNAPALLKEALPGGGSYNLFLMDSNKYTPGRELYCTPYGCFTYQKAGAKDVPTIGGNLGLVSGAKSGKYPFEIIPQQEAEPGDLGLLVDQAPADYGDPNSRLIFRPHHTTIVSETNPQDPNSIRAYNAVGGSRLRFRDTPVTADEIQYLRYVGQSPRMEEELESNLTAQQAILQDNNIFPTLPTAGPQAISNTQISERTPVEINPTNVPNPRSRGLGSIFPSLKRAMGGPVNYQQGGSPDRLMQIQNGGTHEESSLGGVPMGTDAEGNQVLVEEGETVRKGSESDFVFSDRLRLTKQDAEEFAIDKKFVGQTFADISKKLETRSRRKNDPIDKQTVDIQLNRLEEAQEVFKQRKLAEAQEMYGGSREPSPEQSMEPPMGSPMGAPQGPSPEEMAIMQAMQQGAAGMGPQGMGQPSPEMMPPQGPPQMMNYGGLIYANGGPTQTQAQTNLDNYFRSLEHTSGINDPRAPKRTMHYDESLDYFYRDEAGNIINTDLGQPLSPEDQMIANAQTSASSTAAVAAAPVTTNDAVSTQPAVQPAPVVNNQGAAAPTAGLPNITSLGTPPAIDYGGTGLYSTAEVIPSGSSMPFGPLGANRGTQPEMPTYETPLWVTGMQGAPVVSNLLSSAFLPEGFNYEDYRVSPDDTIIQKPDITPDLQDIDKMTQMGRNAISARATSTGELLVGLSRLTAMGMAEMGKIRNQQYSDYLQQLEAQKLRNLQIAQMNSQTRSAVDAANVDLEKERLNLINAAATEASKVADALRQENLSKYEIGVLYKMYPYLTQYNPE
jgi:hypothetical protein